MNAISLRDFIARTGDEEAARILGIRPRTAQAYRLGNRVPRPTLAREFVRRAPELTMASIYDEPADDVAQEAPDGRHSTEPEPAAGDTG